MRGKSNKRQTRSPTTRFSGSSYFSGSSTRAGKRRSEQQRITQRRAWRAGILLLALTVVIIWAAQLIYVFHIRVEGKISAQRQADITAAVAGYLDERPFIGRLKPVIDTADLSRHLQTAFPDVAFTPISLISTDIALTVSAEERQARAVWTVAANDGDWLVDQDGRLFQPSDSTKPESLDLPRIEDELFNSNQAEAGQTVINVDTLNFIDSIAPELAGLDYAVDRYLLGERLRELAVVLSNRTYALRLSLERSVDDQMGELAELQTYLEANNINPQQYIDLRVDNTAYYR